ncbi:MAG: urease accessory protein UreD [Cyanobacteria bacterium REEB459]|nr:urease accessory protein UreD [Cyanobacteria bacterium REEB459]
MTLSVTSPSPRGWLGSARLVYTSTQGSCRPTQTYTQAPLRVQRPLYPEGLDLCHSVLMHTAGGMVAGDRLTIDLHLQAHSQALVTSAAASKVYGGQTWAEQTTTLSLAPQTCLEWFPQETIVFDQAHYRQHLRVDLAPHSIWCGWEITRFGRTARGERFNQGHWQSALEVWQGRQPLWLDRQALLGGSVALDSVNGLGGQPVVASLVLVGIELSDQQLTQLRSLGSGRGQVGLTRLQSGLLCRYRGGSTSLARQWLIDLWQTLRPWYLGRPALVPRVWPQA